MSQTVPAREVINLVVPALNVLRGLEQDLMEHPDCPFRKTAGAAVNNLMDLVNLAKGDPHEQDLPPDRLPGLK
ncbi:MAG: hypothetical protein ACM31P_02225 [Actinomycetota bacterium]